MLLIAAAFWPSWITNVATLTVSTVAPALGSTTSAPSLTSSTSGGQA